MPRLSHVLLLAAIAALAVVAAIGVANASVVGVPTKLTLANSAPAFHGKVKSEHSVCERNRKVKMFQKQSGPDDLLGSDKSNRHGKWKVPVAAWVRLVLREGQDQDQDRRERQRRHLPQGPLAHDRDRLIAAA